MAIEAICDTSVAWDGISEVLDAESSLDSWSKETSEGGYQRGETGYHNRVDLGRACLELSVAHEGTDTEREIVAFELKDIGDHAINGFKERKIKVGLRTDEEFWGAKDISQLKRD